MSTKDQTEIPANRVTWTDRAVDGVILVAVFAVAFSATAALRG